MKFKKIYDDNPELSNNCIYLKMLNYIQYSTTFIMLHQIFPFTWQIRTLFSDPSFTSGVVCQKGIFTRSGQNICGQWRKSCQGTFDRMTSREIKLSKLHKIVTNNRPSSVQKWISRKTVVFYPIWISSCYIPKGYYTCYNYITVYI